MVPLALGTQTVGSVIRPASFCGVVGYKTGHGRLALDGVKPLAAAFDSLGVFARDAADAALWFAAMSWGPAAAPRTGPPRIALVRTADWEQAAPETKTTVEAAASRLAAAGAAVEEPRLSGAFAELAAAQEALFAAGAVEALSAGLAQHAGMLSPQLREVLERGLGLAPAALEEARRTAEVCRAEMAGVYRAFDAALAPAAPGEAPDGVGVPPVLWTPTGFERKVSVCRERGTRTLRLSGSRSWRFIAPVEASTSCRRSSSHARPRSMLGSSRLSVTLGAERMC